MTGVLGILGVGAIGGSIGLRARAGGRYVVGADRDGAALEAALRVGAIDAATTADELSRVETLVIAAHLEPTLREIERLATLERMPALVIDVASVKVPVARAAAALHGFVATHPMAGTQRSGVSAAHPDLFQDRPWAYVPSGNGQLDARARAFIESMGSVAFAISAADHDRAVALTSATPQVVACCLAGLFRANGADARLCGPVARELLRIAPMSFELWRGPLRANAANVEHHLRRLIAELQSTADALAREDIESLAPLFG